MSKSLMLSIIIINYNVKEELLDCIGSIINRSNNISFEIIVIDNSEKNDAEKILSEKYPRVRYFKSTENLGYGNAINLGVKKAKGDYIFVLNPDTRIIKGKITSLINFVKKNKKIGAVAPQILDSGNTAYDEQGAKILTPKYAIFVLSVFNKNFQKK